MSVSIREVRAATIHEWQEIADRCSYATFFHTPSWFAAFSEIHPKCKIVTKRFVFEDGTVAIFPFVEYRTIANLHKNNLIGPFGCYGGWISADDLHSENAVVIVDWIFRNLRSLTWRVNPLDKEASLLERHSTSIDTTELLFLEHFEDESQLRRKYKHSVRKEINKATRAGLTVKLAENWNEWEEYFGLYQTALLRWGDKATSKYPIELFEYFFRLKSDKIKLWLVMHENNIIGGNLNLYHNRHCVEWHAAFDSRFFGTGARNFLVDRIIVHALRQGYGYYDFNPSGGHEGTRKFKQAFGTEQVSSNLIVFDRTPYTVKIFRKLTRLIR